MKDFSWFGGWVIKLVIIAFLDFSRLQEILANSLPSKVTYLSFLSMSYMNFRLSEPTPVVLLSDVEKLSSPVTVAILEEFKRDVDYPWRSLEQFCVAIDISCRLLPSCLPRKFFYVLMLIYSSAHFGVVADLRRFSNCSKIIIKEITDGDLVHLKTFLDNSDDLPSSLDFIELHTNTSLASLRQHLLTLVFYNQVFMLVL
jgi:hypothetical protein